MRKILLLEDDRCLSRGISFKLTKEGYEVFTETTVEGGLKTFKEEHFDLIISDVNLEDGSGFDFCQEIRKISSVHIIFLTALDKETDIVNGYDVGCDDYIIKPFSLMVLISKVSTIMKRLDYSEKCINVSAITSQDITFYIEKMKIIKNKNEIYLSKNELKLFMCLISNPGRTYTKQQLLEELWDSDGRYIEENTLAVNIRRLREKIEDNPSKPLYIINKRGIGYSWGVPCEKKCC